MLQNLPVIKNLSPTQRAIAVTAGLLLLYELGKNISLPFLFSNSNLSNAEYEALMSNRFSFFILGIMPALAGFFLVEVLSFFLPPLKTWRRGGIKGRGQLTKCALMVSLVLAAVQAYGITLSFVAMRTPDGQPFFDNASLLQQGLLGFVIVLGVVTLYGMAEMITRHGIGNGFAVIIGYGIVRYFPTSMDRTETMPLGRKNILTGEPPNLVGILILIFILVVLYQKFWHRVPDLYKRFRRITFKTQAEGKPVDFQLPYLPQGVFPLLWPASIIANLYLLIYSRGWSTDPFLDSTTWSYLFFYTVLLPVTSYLGYFLISHPKRIAHNMMGKLSFHEDWENKVQQNVIRSTLIITLVWFLWNVPLVNSKGDVFPFSMIGLTGIIILAAIVKDLVSEYRFRKEAENPRVLETFDNVHFVTYLKGLFEREEIRFCIQAFEYRRLFYFFEPLIKMRLLVDARDWDKAQELADLENVTLI